MFVMVLLMMQSPTLDPPIGYFPSISYRLFPFYIRGYTKIIFQHV